MQYLTVSGSYLDADAVTGVFIGGVSVTWFKAPSSTELDIVTAAHSVGTFPVSLKFRNGVTQYLISTIADDPQDSGDAEEYEFEPSSMSISSDHEPIDVGESATFTIDVGPPVAPDTYVEISVGGLTGGAFFTDEDSPGSEYPGVFRRIEVVDGTATFSASDLPAGIDVVGAFLEDYGYIAAMDEVVISDDSVPVAVNDSFGSPHGATTVDLPVLDNDFDADGNTLAIINPTLGGTISSSLGGTVSNVGGTLQFAPNGTTGTDSFTYTISDGYGGTSTATVAIDLDNSAPVAADDTYGSPHGATTVDLPVLDNDSDADGDTLTITSPTLGGTISSSLGGTVSNVGGTLQFSPNGTTGTDSFTYTISDGNGGTSTATVSIVLDNQAPVATYVEVDTDGSSDPIEIDVLNNASDADGDALTVSGYTSPTKGSVALSGDRTYFTYTPGTGTTGTDTFTYTVSDGYGGTSTATVIVHLDNEAPVAVDDSVTTSPHGAAITIAVLDNDTDLNGDTLSITGHTTPSHGSVTVNGDGTITYTPTGGATGTDSFTYTISDGHGGTSTATVTIDLDNQAPIAGNDTYGSPHGATTVVLPVLDNDIDPDGDSLSITSHTTPTHGTLTVNGDGTITYTPNYTYTSASFTYTVSDGYGGTSTATVTINYANQAPVATNDTFGSPHGGTEVLDVLGNDTDADGDSLSITSHSTPAHGTVTINGDDTISYETTTTTGTDSFTYTISDGHGGTSTATVTLDLDNQAPSAHDDAVVGVDWTTTIYPLDNDFDPDGDPLSVSIDSGPSKGFLIANTDGSYVYTPNDGASGWDTFTYTISDPYGGTSSATVYIELGASNGSLVVTSSSDAAPSATTEGELRFAVQAANALASEGIDSDITFSGGVTTIALSHGELDLNGFGAITINGGSGVTIDSDGSNPAFVFDNGANVTMEHITISSGSGDPGITVQGGSALTISNTTISEMYVSSSTLAVSGTNSIADLSFDGMSGVSGLAFTANSSANDVLTDSWWEFDAGSSEYSGSEMPLGSITLDLSGGNFTASASGSVNVFAVELSSGSLSVHGGSSGSMTFGDIDISGGTMDVNADHAGAMTVAEITMSGSGALDVEATSATSIEISYLNLSGSSCAVDVTGSTPISFTNMDVGGGNVYFDDTSGSITGNFLGVTGGSVNFSHVNLQSVSMNGGSLAANSMQVLDLWQNGGSLTIYSSLQVGSSA